MWDSGNAKGHYMARNLRGMPFKIGGPRMGNVQVLRASEATSRGEGIILKIIAT